MAIDTCIRRDAKKNHYRPSYSWLKPCTAVSRLTAAMKVLLTSYPLCPIHFALRVALMFICQLISSCTYVMIYLSQAMVGNMIMCMQSFVSFIMIKKKKRLSWTPIAGKEKRSNE